MQRSGRTILPGLLLAPLLAQAQQEMPLHAGDIPNAIAAPDEEATRDPNDAYTFSAGGIWRRPRRRSSTSLC